MSLEWTLTGVDVESTAATANHAACSSLLPRASLSPPAHPWTTSKGDTAQRAYSVAQEGGSSRPNSTARL